MLEMQSGLPLSQKSTSEMAFKSVPWWERATCYLLQALSLAVYYAAIGLPPAIVIFTILSIVEDRILRVDIAIGALVIAGLLLWPLYLSLSIGIKWLVIGRFEAGQVPLWSIAYWRFWVVRLFAGLSGANFFRGTPLMNFYFRAMGAKVGANALISTLHCVAFDLVSIGEGASIGAETQLLGYRIEDGMLVLGHVDIGNDCFIGMHCALGLDVAMNAGARLDDLSLLSDGTRMIVGECRRGVPAVPAQVDVPQALDGEEVPRRPFLFGLCRLALIYVMGSLAIFRIGARSFVGNSALVLGGIDIGDDCLIGVQSTPPAGTSRKPAGTRRLGSPDFELPGARSFSGFKAEETYQPTPALYLTHAIIDAMRILLSLLLTTAGIIGFAGLMILAWTHLPWWAVLVSVPFASMLLSWAAIMMVAGFKDVVLGRYEPAAGPLWSKFIWLNALVNGIYGSIATPVLQPLLGTPFAVWGLRQMGCRIGRHVFVDTTLFSGFDLAQIGDYAAVNYGATIQTDLFEDHILKAGRLEIGNGANVGNMAIVLYDTKMGLGSTLAPLSVLMKGETLPSLARWHGVPAQPDRPRPGDGMARAVETTVRFMKPPSSNVNVNAKQIALEARPVTDPPGTGDGKSPIKMFSGARASDRQAEGCGIGRERRPGHSVKSRGNVSDEQKPGGPELRVVIVGGGPGGLFSAWSLAGKAGNSCKITILEASNRLGGKIVTGNFAGAGLYEAGVAEIYDYSALGPDPLRELIEQDLDLQIKHIRGGGCVLDGNLLPSTDTLADHYGTDARDVAKAFRARCASLLSPRDFYKSVREADNSHPWVNRTAEEILATEIEDEVARRYIRVMSHSDVAAPPHLTNGLNFLKNILMDVDGYLDVFSVVGGNEQIVKRLVDELDAEVKLNAPVRSVQPLPGGTYRLEVVRNGTAETIEADFVILALPLTALSIVEWRSAALQRAMADHISYFDRPGHYLRATLLFKRPFWREHLDGAWWMLDAFDGCCVYDEGARHDLGGWGALGFLIAGNAALALANMPDDRIEQLCLDALPPALAQGHELYVDCRIHRWMASVNAIPGGSPVRSRLTNHRPDPTRLPGVLVVGDYMFDATLNGVLDSAEAATDLILSDILLRRRSFVSNQESTVVTDLLSSGRPADAVRDLFFDGKFVADLLDIVWGVAPGATILVAGSGSGAMVGALRSLQFDAWGIESSSLACQRTPGELQKYNVLGDLTALPFPDRHFDAVIETGLCQLPRDKIARAVAELRRVTRRGLVLGSVTTDLPIDLIERHDLLADVKTLASRWDWSEQLFAVGFDHTLIDPLLLSQAWKRTESAGGGPGHWYEDAESLLYCFYGIDSRQAENDAGSDGVDELQVNGWVTGIAVGQ
jgi:monoamine oxidase/carbonic anhydrase/acetyltransferase-like protein (isoleucine patch superfamily)/SAM-dependent methyltransferase